MSGECETCGNHTLECVCLHELTNEVKKIWKNFHYLRLNNGKIEFSIQTINNELAWFPYFQAPEKVEKYINSYFKIS